MSGHFEVTKSPQAVGNQAIGQTDIEKLKMSVCYKPIFRVSDPVFCTLAPPR